MHTSAPETRTHHAPLSDRPAPTVLVVDDDPDIRQVLELMLRDEGYRVALAADGDEALERVAEERPDLVLLDLWMPGMDGWTLQQRLADQEPDLPVVVMTAGRGPLADAYRHRVAGFLAKPFDMESLFRVVNGIARPA